MPGHYVKMVHNGIEYGLMQAYAEGFELLHKSEYGLDMERIAKLWGQGSVVRSWLLELAARAFETDGNDLSNLEGWVEDSGEGRWTLLSGIDHDVPMPALSAALFSRFTSRGQRRLHGAHAGGAAQPVRRPRGQGRPGRRRRGQVGTGRG